MLARRLIFVLCILWMDHFVTGQLMIQFATNIGLIIFFQLKKPLDSSFANKMETFNECTMLFINYHLLCFTDFAPSVERRRELGFSYIAVMLSNIGLHLTLISAASFVAFKLRLRKRYYSARKGTKAVTPGSKG